MSLNSKFAKVHKTIDNQDEALKDLSADNKAAKRQINELSTKIDIKSKEILDLETVILHNSRIGWGKSGKVR